MFVNLINKDEDLAKYLRDNNCLNKIKNFHSVAVDLDNYLQKSPSLKQMDLCRPISGIKKLIENQKLKEESPDSTFYEMEKNNLFDESKIICNDNQSSINYKKINTKKDYHKTEENLFTSSPQKKSRESSLFNFNNMKKENLIPIKENIEVITEENNEFLLTGMKFNNTNKKKTLGFTNNIETDFEKFQNNKKNSKEILPPLFKKSSTIISQDFRNSILFGKHDDNDRNSRLADKKSFRNSISPSKDTLNKNLHAILSPSNQALTTIYNRTDEDYAEEKNFQSRKKTNQSENRILFSDMNNSKENLKTNNINKQAKKNFLPKINKNKKPLDTHTIIDYSINKSGYIYKNEVLFSEEIKNVNIDTKPTLENENNHTIPNTVLKNKLAIKNEKIKNLLEKSKEKGFYAPYFSLCKNCNERNNEFYNQIDLKNAIGIINIINKGEKRPPKLDKF